MNICIWFLYLTLDGYIEVRSDCISEDQQKGGLMHHATFIPPWEMFTDPGSAETHARYMAFECDIPYRECPTT